MPPYPNRRVGTAPHHRPHQRQQHPQSRRTRYWGIGLLTILPATVVGAQAAMGQPMRTSAALSLVGEETTPLGLGQSSQPLDLEAPADLDGGEPLFPDPETLDSETPDDLEADSAPDVDSSSVRDASDPVYLRPSAACPAEYETLVTTLLRDLPQYANLVAARSFRPSIVDPATDATRPAIPPTPSPMGTMLIASQPDFEPIDLADRAFGTGLDAESDLRQVFFTTLERQYLSHQVVSLQQFHWLFLVQAEDGWRSVLLYSSLGGNPTRDLADQRLTPPQESSHGIVGQAVRLWLRDCRAGAVFPSAAPPEFQ